MKKRVISSIAAALMMAIGLFVAGYASSTSAPPLREPARNLIASAKTALTA